MRAWHNYEADIAAAPAHDGGGVSRFLDCTADHVCWRSTVLIGKSEDDVAVLGWGQCQIWMCPGGGKIRGTKEAISKNEIRYRGAPRLQIMMFMVKLMEMGSRAEVNCDIKVPCLCISSARRKYGHRWCECAGSCR